MIELISIHIPKTGGRSFREVLEKAYGPASVCSYDRKDVIALKGTLTLNIPEEKSVLHGHFYYSERIYTKNILPP